MKTPFQKGTERRNVVFSTYHSLDVIAQAQKKGAPAFDLVICDEAHRTTGVGAPDKKEESYFTAIHNPAYIRAKKRLYMTATPRIYSAESKVKAKHHDVEVYSMDDSQKYGEELYRLGFSEAVQKDLLSDYKVMILAVSEEQMASAMQNTLAQNGGLAVGDAAKLVGCWNGLAKRFTPGDKTAADDRTPMRRAVAFTQRIKDSRQVEAEFNNIVQEYGNRFSDIGQLMCEVEHVDGTMNAQERAKKLQWLKETPADADPSKYDTGNNYCRILSNARCLSEGVDVPAWMRSSFSIRANRKWMWCKRLGASCEKHRINNGAMSFCRWSYRRASRPKLRWMTTKTTKSCGKSYKPCAPTMNALTR